MPVRASSHGVSRRRESSRLTGAIFVGISLIAAAFIFRDGQSTSRKNTESIVESHEKRSEQTMQVYSVPAEPVPAGTKLRDVRFKSVSFSREQVPEGALLSVDAFLEAVTVASLPAGLPVFKENLSFEGQGTNPVLESIPSGMRAMTIRVDATSSVEGWAGSGSVVDVLLIEKDKTSVIAERVKVLSAERSVAPVEGASSPSVPSTVTLLVTQEQCLAINTAIPLGKIAFALRGRSDEAGWRDRKFEAGQLQVGVNRDKSSAPINGYFSIRDGAEKDKREAYALSDGKWIKTEVVPQGFFPLSKDKVEATTHSTKPTTVNSIAAATPNVSVAGR